MKTEIKKWAFILFAIVAAGVFTPKQSQAKKPGIGVSLQIFYDSLDPYGRWINDRQYGYIWVPDAEPGFQPYATRGHWVQTNFGNTWVSDYDWGWAPFHYGRWVFDDYYGWAWIPGDEWGPGWVNWRSGGGYYGWAPMGPGIHVSINIPLSRWIFVPQRYICHPNIYNYYAGRSRGGYIYQNTTIINNYYNYNNRRYASGPRFDEIQRVTNRPVRVYALNDGDRPGKARIERNAVQIYRPSIDRRSIDSGPARVSSSSDNRNSRNNDNQQGNYERPQPDRNGNTQRDVTVTKDANNSVPQNQNQQRPERVTSNDDRNRELIQQQRDRAEQQYNQQRQQEQERIVQREMPRQEERREERQSPPRREEQQRNIPSNREVQRRQEPEQRNSQPSRNDAGRNSGRPQRVGD